MKHPSRLLLLLLPATLAVYMPAWHGGLLWDDAQHLTPEALRTAGGLWRIWFEPGATQQYYPLTHSAFWLQQRLWGSETLGYHVVNIGLHAFSAFLLALILARLSVPGVVLAAFVFALHPIQVESVAWMTELKNTLSGVFFLASALSYLRFDERREPDALRLARSDARSGQAAPLARSDARPGQAYAAAIVLFVLALLAKTVTAVLPVALLVVVWWRRGRIDLRHDIRPLLPLFGIGAAAGLLTASVERTSIGAHGAEFSFSLVDRLLIAGRAIWFYLATLLWPSNLIFNYPRWTIDAGAWWQYLFPLAALALAVVLWMQQSRGRAPLAAFLLFVVLLGPALGFVNVYPFRFSFVADHFAYLAVIPIAALVAAGLESSLVRRRVARSVRVGAAVALACVLGVLTFRQSRVYADAETLYRDTIARNPSSWLAHGNLGTLLIPTRPDEAIEHLDAALRLKPDAAEIHNDRGTVLQRAGRLDEAVAEYREAVRLVPTLANAHNNLANVLMALGHHEEAVAAGRRALELKPDLVEAHYTMGLARQALGQPEAAEHFRAVLERRPDFAAAHNALGVVLQGIGRQDEALAQFSEAVRLDPGAGNARFNLASTLQQLGRAKESVPHYLEVLKLNPSDAAAHNNLAVAYEALGQHEEALKHLREAQRLGSPR